MTVGEIRDALSGLPAEAIALVPVADGDEFIPIVKVKPVTVIDEAGDGEGYDLAEDFEEWDDELAGDDDAKIGVAFLCLGDE